MHTIIWIFVALAVAGVMLMRREARKIARAFAGLAKRYGGEVRRPFASYPEWQFEHDDGVVEVSANGGEYGPFTSLTYRVCYRPAMPEFIIASRSMATYVMSPRRDLNKHKTADAAFDAKFSLRCHDPATAGMLLGSALRKLLLNLNGGDGVSMNFLVTDAAKGEYRLSLSIERILLDPVEYEALIDCALRVIQRLRELT